MEPYSWKDLVTNISLEQQCVLIKSQGKLSIYQHASNYITHEYTA